MMVLYKRQQHKASKTTSHAYLLNTKVKFANSDHSTSACTIHADLHKNQGLKNTRQDDTVTTKDMHVHVKHYRQKKKRDW